ncbi:hypothetical protein [Lysinibacter cavernae]|uniref:Uncharacterized protein n=1 Tax=Lysinibacter cavernae TaxID=1640652 RepID=A0A7X5R287_9MICO|nr:hypothetical protein [Lysinibacter cavernae]NIH54259.1 hypothetical protein [Lysinibacter cavernae]
MTQHQQPPFGHEPNPQFAQQPAQPQHQQQTQPPATSQQRTLTTFLKVSIVLLVIVSVASIALLFVGDFDGRFVRVFSTLGLFAAFTLFTALDTRIGKNSEWYAPLALIGNTYMLGLSLIIIWITKNDEYLLFVGILWYCVVVIGVTRLVIFAADWLLRLTAGSSSVLTRFAFTTGVLSILSGIMFTAPLGIQAFDVEVSELYWRIAVAVLILTGLFFAITMLLQWYFNADVRAEKRAAQQQQAAAFNQARAGARFAYQPIQGQGAPMPQPYAPIPQQQGYPQQGMPPQGMPQQGMPPQGMPQQGMPPQGYGQPQPMMPPQAFPGQPVPQPGQPQQQPGNAQPGHQPPA